jgi:hypothetical protein
MPRLTPIAVLCTGLLAHPAVGAWRALRPARVEPDAIQVFREGRRSGIYRLEGVGLGGSAVIAKRCRTAVAAIERTIYEEVLPHVPVTVPHYYGAAEADGETCWLFLEDVGRVQYSVLDQEQRALAGRWLGRLHTSAARVAAAPAVRQHLPDAGPGRYLAHLRGGRRTIVRHLAHPALSAQHVAVLEMVVGQQDILEARWRRVEAACDGAPSTLVHGDFRPKNVHVRIDHAGTTLLPMDWEDAGWGVPAADLLAARVDLTAYWSVVREHWTGLDARAVGRLATIGQVFRWLAAVNWDSASLASDRPEVVHHVVSNMRIYQAELDAAIHQAGLQGAGEDA